MKTQRGLPADSGFSRGLDDAVPLCSHCQASVPADAERCPHCGAWLSQRDGALKPSDESLESEIRTLLNQGQKIEAIKIYRQRTGQRLADAKHSVERLERGVKLADEKGSPQEIEAQLLELLRAGQKIAAIKRYREQTRSGLKEAKEAVEALAARHGILPQRSGCLGALASILAVASAMLSMVLVGWLRGS